MSPNAYQIRRVQIVCIAFSFNFAAVYNGYWRLFLFLFCIALHRFLLFVSCLHLSFSLIRRFVSDFVVSVFAPNRTQFASNPHNQHTHTLDAILRARSIFALSPSLENKSKPRIVYLIRNLFATSFSRRFRLSSVAVIAF